ncbi:thermonuclease family protein (plasmid) [Agrobacterium leguminum]|uniref:thermonuclease family protein n=1 Tax=Agrobacterium leguminum TaxID=2792015 RepID=UPI0010C9961A|nr:thermonuclease family protein [Agrobacterium leguminum]WFS69588.1 thermonuclease family protein [Agrobacterium leguminum]
MLITTITASGLYAGMYIMPGLLAEQMKAPPSPPPVIQVQAQQAPPPQTKQAAPQQEFTQFPTTAQFETGDTWVANGRRYRLYGLQTCLRGTQVTLSQGVVRDCGELNLIMTQALIRDTKPVCTTVKDLDQNNAVVVCQTTTGQRGYDLATYIIAQGWGFAAVDGAGQLIVPGYRVAEETARSARVGLWAYSDLPHPVSVLMEKAQQQ